MIRENNGIVLNVKSYINQLNLKVALCTTEDKLYVKKMKLKITVYFVTSVHKMLLNIVSSQL